jgi:formamidopyrimidine-DNA glycosylase
LPELPDLTIYIEAIERRVRDEVLRGVRIGSPFLLRTVEPSPREAIGRRVASVRRIGKRIVIELEEEIVFAIHLMIAGRFRWESPGAKLPGRVGLAAFDFDPGTLVLTEAGSKRRASLHVFAGPDGARALDRGGLEPLECSLEDFGAALRRENHTVKRSLTDPRLFSGIGNAYSDEILHRARLSPLKLTSKLSDEEVARLHEAMRATLEGWIASLRAETGDGFPSKVTAFRPDMAVHGRFGMPCPDCGTPVQRIVYAENETNYCARCQTGGRLLADRARSRLLRDDWPRSIDEVE